MRYRKLRISRKMKAMRVILLFMLFIPEFSTAQVVPADLTETQQEKLDQFVLDYIQEMRVKEVRPQPEVVEKFNQEYAEQCLERANADYEKYGHWFYCQGKDGYWDAVVSYRVYWQLVHYYGGLENIPGYTPEKHQKAIGFWQSWQQKDGSFKNPLSPGKEVNQKYIPPPNIMGLLGCKPLYKTSGYGAAEVDTVYYLEKSAAGRLHDAMARGAVMFTKIHEGETKYIPILERGIELGLTYASPETGMFQGKDFKPQGATWTGYGTTMETMKGLARLLGYMGVENIPYRHKRADALIENQEYFRKGHVAVMRNTAEMYIHCLLESSYRQEELLEALAGNAESLLKAAQWKASFEDGGGDYTAFSMTMMGPYLQWEGYQGKAPRIPFYQGAAHDWRVVIGPYGRCANVIRKTPEELLWDKDWSYEQYGLRARDAAYDKATVVDVVPATSEGWEKTTDEKGRLVLSREFILGKERPENPYLKLKWEGGDIEILINGISVRKKLGGMAEYGGVYIVPEAAKSLHPGKNTITIRTAKAQEEPLNASAGLIDWKVSSCR